MNFRLLFFLAVLALARAGLMLVAGVSPENAMFFICAEHPAAAYFDGPAGTAMLVRAAAFLGGDWWLLIGPLAGILASLSAWRLARMLFGETSATWGVIALNLVPAFNAQAFVAGPHLPALTLTLLGISFVWEAIHRQTPHFLSWFYAAIALAGACQFAFWPAATAFACAIFSVSLTKGREGIPLVGACLLVVVAGMSLVPAMQWNASQEWIPIAGWTARSLMAWNTTEIVSGIGALLAGASPLLVLLLVIAVRRLAPKALEKPNFGFALVAALPAGLVTLLFAYRGWDAAPMALPALAILLPAATEKLKPALLIVCLAVAAIFSVPVWLAYPERTSTARSAAAAVIALEEKLSPQLPAGLFFIASEPDLASALGYHLRTAFIAPEGHPRVYSSASQDISSQYDLWPSYDDFVETEQAPDNLFKEVKAVNPFLGHAAIYVGNSPPEELPSAIRSAFSEVQLVQKVGNGKDQRFIYLCLDYQTLPL